MRWQTFVSWWCRYVRWGCASRQTTTAPVVVTGPNAPTPTPTEPTVDPVARRAGTPALEGRGFCDADGPYLALGTSLFWAPWAYLHDREKLDANLAYLKGRVDYIRVLLLVDGGLWSQRRTTCREIIEQDVLRKLAVHCYTEYGIRVMPTLFGGVLETREDRDALVAYVAATVPTCSDAIHHLEVANEADHNGFDRNEILAHARTLGTLLTPHARALTAPVASDMVAYYADADATLMTLHLERDISGTGGLWRPVRQAREGEILGRAWSSNEPIGIASSVEADDDPLRLTMSAVLTWLCRGASYVLHTGAGIYGLAYQGPTGPRTANLWEQPTMTATLDALTALRRVLPATLPNWQFLNNNPRYPAYPFDVTPLLEEDHVLRSFVATTDTAFVCAPIAVRTAVPYRARRPLQFTHYDPLSSAVVATVTLQTDESYTLTGTVAHPTAAIFIGTYL